MKQPWMDMTVRDFQSALASSSPTPGGGTAAAVALGQAAALTIMVCDLTISSEKWESGWSEAESTLPKAVRIMSKAGELADEDSDAFDQVMNSFKMARETDEEKAERRESIRNSTLMAAEVPMETARLGLELLKCLPNLGKLGNQNAISDVGVAGLLASAACKGALFNVEINLSSLPDEMGLSLRKEAPDIMESCRVLSRQIMDIVKENL